jgi:hypothetical protein
VGGALQFHIPMLVVQLPQFSTFPKTDGPLYPQQGCALAQAAIPLPAGL